MKNKMVLMTKDNRETCAKCGYSEGMHPIFISGKHVQIEGEVFLDWLCEKFEPQNHSPSRQGNSDKEPEDTKWLNESGSDDDLTNEDIKNIVIGNAARLKDDESLSDKRKSIPWNHMFRSEIKALIEKQDKEAVKKLKDEWKLKMRRMEVISVEVAIYELNQLADNIFGKELT